MLSRDVMSAFFDELEKLAFTSQHLYVRSPFTGQPLHIGHVGTSLSPADLRISEGLAKQIRPRDMYNTMEAFNTSGDPWLRRYISDKPLEKAEITGETRLGPATTGKRGPMKSPAAHIHDETAAYADRGGQQALAKAREAYADTRVSTRPPPRPSVPSTADTVLAQNSGVAPTGAPIPASAEESVATAVGGKRILHPTPAAEESIVTAVGKRRPLRAANITGPGPGEPSTMMTSAGHTAPELVNESISPELAAARKKVVYAPDTAENLVTGLKPEVVDIHHGNLTPEQWRQISGAHQVHGPGAMKIRPASAQEAASIGPMPKTAPAPKVKPVDIQKSLGAAEEFAVKKVKPKIPKVKIPRVGENLGKLAPKLTASAEKGLLEHSVGSGLLKRFGKSLLRFAKMAA